MSWWQRLLTYLGTSLLVLAGTDASASKANQNDTSNLNKESDHSEVDPFANNAVKVSDDFIMLAAAHANSGPTSHSNVPGHANFSMKLRETAKLRPSQIRDLRRKLSAGSPGAASHVNSGPTTHSNVPGHANFSMKLSNKRQRLKPSQINHLRSRLEGRKQPLILKRPGAIKKSPGLVRQPGGAAAHVNSGPTTHSNVPGHANFSMKLNKRLSKSQISVLRRRLSRGGGSAAAHVNSGPTSHSNIGNHYNFSKTLRTKGRLNPVQVKTLQQRLNVK